MALMDTAASAVATLLVGLTAAAVLPADWLGAHQLLFSCAILLSSVPVQRRGATLVRARAIGTITSDAAQTVLGALLRLGCVLGLAIYAVGAYLVVRGVPWSICVPMAIGAHLIVAGIPYRDALRSYAHVSGRRFAAVAASLVQLALSAAFVGCVIAVPVLRPFLLITLGLSSTIAGFIGWRIVRSDLDANGATQIEPGSRSLVMAGVVPQSGAVAQGFLIQSFGSLTMLGHVAASMQIAQGINFIASALSAITMKKSQQAGFAMNISDARPSRWIFGLGITSIAALTIGVSHFTITSSLLRELLPNSYAVPGLLLTLIVALWLERQGAPQYNELIGAAKFQTLERIRITQTSVSITMAFAAVWIGSYAAPLGIGIAGALQWLLLSLACRRLYASRKEDTKT